MPKFTFKGIIATAFTPFLNDKGRSLNLSVIPQIADYFATNKYECVLINGTYGEGMAMSADERIQVAEAWSAAAKTTKQQLVVQVGGTNLPDVKKLAAHAQSINASALLCLPELYYKPKTTEELVDYLQEVAEAAPETPLFYYHSPAATGVTLSMAEFIGKLEDRIPSFAGIKFASSNIDDCSHALRCAEGRYSIIVASNHNLPVYIKLGIETFMPTAINVYPEIINKIFHLTINDNLSDALLLQEHLSVIVNEIAGLNNGVAATVMKFMTEQKTEIKLGSARKPLQSFATPEKLAKVNEYTAIMTSLIDNVLPK